MAIFKAYQKVKADALQALQVFFDGKTSGADQQGYQIKSGKTYLKVKGEGFEYSGFGSQKSPVFGTIEKIEVYVSGDLAYKIKGLSILYGVTIPLTTADDLVGKVFPGDDTIKGSDAGDTLRGYAGNDVIKGGAGNDKLQGDEGADTLSGGRGKDKFFFTVAPSTGADTITSFGSNEKIMLDKSVFKGLGAKGPLAELAFHEGTAAEVSGQHVVYDSQTGGLYYDDGPAGAAPQLIANLPVGTHLDAGNIFVI